MPTQNRRGAVPAPTSLTTLATDRPPGDRLPATSRPQQINYLASLADRIATTEDPVSALLDYLDASPDTHIPSWFTQHDEDLLITMVLHYND